MFTCWLTCISQVLRPHSLFRFATVNAPANRRMPIASVVSGHCKKKRKRTFEREKQHIMRTLISIILFISVTTCFGQQQKQVTFKKEDYPISKFTVTNVASNFGQVKIITTMVSPKVSSNSFSCHSWLTIQKNDKVLKQKFYGHKNELYKQTTHKQLIIN